MERPWTSHESLSQLSLFADWDSVASMLLSLRIHLFEYGTVPTWNFALCGGRPELAVPFSWAYTWPSLFAYALPPYPALFAVWITMTAVGFVSARALFLRWTGSRLGATVGAGTWVACGCFAAHFNAGHVSWAFFHWIPLLMLLFERGFERSLRGADAGRLWITTTAAAFLFFTAGLPHALLHLYPAFLLLVVFRVASAVRPSGLARALGAAAPALAAQALGLWLAAYKLWPAIRWQLGAARLGVRREAYTTGEVLWSTLAFVPDHFSPERQQAWHVYPSWEYDAYLGPAAWLLALVAAAVACSRRARAASQPDAAGPGWLAGYAGLLILLGADLSLGNAHALSLARAFRHLPVLDGVRVFQRYEILVAFGVCIRVASALGWLSQRLRAGRLRSALLAAAVLATTGPVAAQAVCMVWNLGATPNWEIRARYEAQRRPDPPQLIAVESAPPHEAGHQLALLEQGYWIANCRSDLRLPPRPPFPIGSTRPLTSPAPSALLELARDRLVLGYTATPRVPTRSNLRTLASFRIEPAARPGPEGGVTLPAGALTERRLRIDARYAGPAEGAVISAAGLAVAGLASALRGRRRSRAGGGSC